MYITNLTCFACGSTYPHDRLTNLCACGKPLRVDYDLEAVREAVTPDDLKAGRRICGDIARCCRSRPKSSRRRSARAARR